MKWIKNKIYKLIEYLYLKQKNNLVFYDCLTGCLTRHYFDIVAKQIYQPIEVYVSYVDIDNLKHINDTQGHNVGSKYIKDIAYRLLTIQYAFDVIRLGGDEFIVISPIDITASLKTIANISFGVYQKEKYEDLSSGVRKADKLMYKDKILKNNKKVEENNNE